MRNQPQANNATNLANAISFIRSLSPYYETPQIRQQNIQISTPEIRLSSPLELAITGINILTHHLPQSFVTTALQTLSTGYGFYRLLSHQLPNKVKLSMS